MAVVPDTPMKAPTPPRRVPGFPAPAAPPAARPAPVGVADRSAGSKPLNVRILIPLLQRYQQLVRELNDAGYRTSLAELIHALMHPGPSTPDEARALIRDWRRATDPDR